MTTASLKKTMTTAKKTLRWIYSTLQWLTILFFGALFVVGLVLRLPWKILLVLAIIPFTGFFVPHKFQKWIWGFLTIALIGMLIWIEMPVASQSGWQSFRFDKDYSQLTHTKSYDEKNNAALLYEQVLGYYDEKIFTFRFKNTTNDILTLWEPWSEYDHPQLAFWLAEHEDGIDKLIQASQQRTCRFVVPYDLSSLNNQFKRINQMKGWAKLLKRAANLDLHHKRYDQALDKYLAILNMAHHEYKQDTLLDQAAGIFLEMIARASLNIFIIEQCQSPDQLDRIKKEAFLVTTGWPNSWYRIVQTEQLLVKNIAALCYETNREGHIRISRNIVRSVCEGLDYPVPRFLYSHEMMKCGTLGLWFTIPHKPEKLGQLIDNRFEKYSKKAKQGIDLGKKFGRNQLFWNGLNIQSIIDWLALEKVSYYYPLDHQNNVHRAAERATAVLIECRQYYDQHNHWPNSLDKLTALKDTKNTLDPLSGKSFVYKLTEDGFTLYSLGPNGIDDDGVNRSIEKKDDIRIWPKRR